MNLRSLIAHHKGEYLLLGEGPSFHHLPGHSRCFGRQGGVFMAGHSTKEALTNSGGHNRVVTTETKASLLPDARSEGPSRERAIGPQ